MEKVLRVVDFPIVVSLDNSSPEILGVNFNFGSFEREKNRKTEQIKCNQDKLFGWKSSSVLQKQFHQSHAVPYTFLIFIRAICLCSNLQYCIRCDRGRWYKWKAWVCDTLKATSAMSNVAKKCELIFNYSGHIYIYTTSYPLLSSSKSLPTIRPQSNRAHTLWIWWLCYTFFQSRKLENQAAYKFLDEKKRCKNSLEIGFDVLHFHTKVLMKRNWQRECFLRISL